jgi:peptidoglycan/xylan/chitin deacetylase (PgdA/CDA1 family)
VAHRSLGRASVRRLLFRGAAARGLGLALVYHRVGPEAASRSEIVPTLPLDAFRQQLLWLREVGEIVPLAELTSASARGAKPRFALSFDDDYLSHVEHALPVLRELGLPATFFLSGRCLHGLGPYWWERLEQAIAQQGLAAVCARLGLSATDPVELAAECERTGRIEVEALELLPRGGDPGDSSAGLDETGILALATAGMDIGFHTLEHPLLVGLGQEALEGALSKGRGELSEVVGRRLDRLAYPHGKADLVAARAVRRTAFQAAYTGLGRPVSATSDPFLLARWEPPQRGSAGFLEGLAACLMRSPVGPPV